MVETEPIKLELLAPARDAETAAAAIIHGADAVYIGANAFGARSAATNTIDNIKNIVDLAHRFGVKVYVTVNTIVFEDEISEVRKLICKLAKIGVDALIVQDMGVLELDLPPIELHASTQCNARTIEKLQILAKAGFSQIVLPREFSIEQIAEVHRAIPNTPLEAFVHGALCVSYSGDCHAGQVLTGRSANRGECPQICRLKYTLTDKDGNLVENLPDKLPAERHWLSLADMNRLDELEAMADAGVRSFKVEGRLKSMAYVKNVVAAYSKALDKIVENSKGKYCRASFGKVNYNFTSNPMVTFNRGYTKYFLRPADNVKITSWLTPKHVGVPVAKVIAVNPRFLTVNMSNAIHNGDGLTWFDGVTLSGLRVNRVERNHIYFPAGASIPTVAGTTLYRNVDAQFDSLMARNDTASRVIELDLVLRKLPDSRVAIDAADSRDCVTTVASEQQFVDKARTPQTQPRRNVMQRLGDTIYSLRSVDDRLEDTFIPSSALVELRRKVVDSLDRAWRIAYRPSQRRSSDLDVDAFDGYVADYHDNIANSCARGFYTGHGATVTQDALEVSMPKDETCVMTTRYCLRRSLGMCLKDNEQGNKLPDKLFLKAPVGTLRLVFDCGNCQMKIYAQPLKS